MQIQIDPNIPANLPPEEIRDFQSFIQTALDGLTASAGGEVMTLGTGMLAGLALIVIVIAGVKIAFSGNIQPWEVVRLVIGIWIPWVMMQFYTATIPGMSQTFPGMIAEGGNFLHEMLLGDIISSMQTELGDMVRAIAANMQTQAAQGNVIGNFNGRSPRLHYRRGREYHSSPSHGAHAHRVIRCHLRSGDLGSNRPGDPHHSRADLHSVSRVRAAGLSLLGLVQRDAYLFALCRDRRVCVAGVQRRGDCVYHDAGRREPGHPIYDASGPLDAGRHSAFHCRDSLFTQMRGTGFDACQWRRSGEGADSWVWRQRQGWQRPAAERQRPRQQHQEGSSEPR